MAAGYTLANKNYGGPTHYCLLMPAGRCLRGRERMRASMPLRTALFSGAAFAAMTMSGAAWAAPADAGAAPAAQPAGDAAAAQPNQPATQPAAGDAQQGGDIVVTGTHVVRD